MFRFVNWPQIVMWHNALPAGVVLGPVCVLKQVERDLGLIYEIKKTGRHKLVGPITLERRTK